MKWVGLLLYLASVRPKVEVTYKKCVPFPASVFLVIPGNHFRSFQSVRLCMWYSPNFIHDSKFCFQHWFSPILILQTVNTKWYLSDCQFTGKPGLRFSLTLISIILTIHLRPVDSCEVLFELCSLLCLFSIG